MHNLIKEQAKANNQTLTQEITGALHHYFEHIRLGTGIHFMKKSFPDLIQVKKELKTGPSNPMDEIVWNCIIEGIKLIETQTLEFKSE